jgi:hypothetical protein
MPEVAGKGGYIFSLGEIYTILYKSGLFPISKVKQAKKL